MTLPTPHQSLLDQLRPLLRAEARAEAHALGCEPADLEQTVWLRLLEALDERGAPGDPAGWLRRTLAEETRALRLAGRQEREYADQLTPDPLPGPEQRHLDAEHAAAVRRAAGLLPGRCRLLLQALLSPRDLTYREIAAELGISQGSVGPGRSHCLNCLRRVLRTATPPSRSRPPGFTDRTEWGRLRKTPKANR